MLARNKNTDILVHVTAGQMFKQLWIKIYPNRNGQSSFSLKSHKELFYISQSSREMSFLLGENYSTEERKAK